MSSEPKVETFAIYYGGGVVYDASGVDLRRCKYMVWQLTSPELLSFHDVRCWLMDLLRLDKEKQDITLKCLLCAKKPPMDSYWFLGDIKGTRKWREFLGHAKPVIGSFVLHVQVHFKGALAVAPVQETEGGVAAPARSSSAHNKETGGQVSLNPGQPEHGAAQPSSHLEDKSDDGSWPTCKHDKLCTIQTSWSREDPGCRFYRCPLFADSSKNCGFTQWLDERFPEKATEHINHLLDSVDSLELQVENLQNELDELRRRHRKESSKEAVGPGDKSSPLCRCDKTPCDGACRNRDSQPRPRKMRRLVRDI